MAEINGIVKYGELSKGQRKIFIVGDDGEERECQANPWYSIHMEHTITLRLSEGVYASLVQAGQSWEQPPEAVAAQMLADTLSDPLIRLFGSVDFPPGDVAERHDEYLGEAIAAEMYRD